MTFGQVVVTVIVVGFFVYELVSLMYFKDLALNERLLLFNKLIDHQTLILNSGEYFLLLFPVSFIKNAPQKFV